jgi:hypothetical protein
MVIATRRMMAIMLLTPREFRRHRVRIDTYTLQ